MTVEQLILKLQKVEDKSIPVLVWDAFNDKTTSTVDACILKEGTVVLANFSIGTPL